MRPRTMDTARSRAPRTDYNFSLISGVYYTYMLLSFFLSAVWWLMRPTPILKLLPSHIMWDESKPLLCIQTKTV